MENSEILGFQFEPTKALQPDSKFVPSLVHQQIVNQALPGETKHKFILGACVSTVVKSATKECLCYHELNSCEYFKIKRLYVYLLINKHAIINLFSIQNTKRQEVFNL